MTAKEWLARLSQLLAGTPPARILWDLRQASIGAVPLQDLRDFSGQVRALATGRRDRGRSAVVCGSTLDYGVARQLATLLSTSRYPVEVAVFLDVDEARAWLANGG